MRVRASRIRHCNNDCCWLQLSLHSLFPSLSRVCYSRFFYSRFFFLLLRLTFLPSASSSISLSTIPSPNLPSAVSNLLATIPLFRHSSISSIQLASQSFARYLHLRPVGFPLQLTPSSSTLILPFSLLHELPVERCIAPVGYLGESRHGACRAEAEEGRPDLLWRWPGGFAPIPSSAAEPGACSAESILRRWQRRQTHQSRRKSRRKRCRPPLAVSRNRPASGTRGREATRSPPGRGSSL
jgi:hypothetical protein